MPATHTDCGLRHDPFTPCPNTYRTGDSLLYRVGVIDRGHGNPARSTHPVYLAGYHADPVVREWRYER